MLFAIDVIGYLEPLALRKGVRIEIHMSEDSLICGPERQEDGAGLGLAICQEISQAHAWHLKVQNANPGAEFVLTFDLMSRV